MLADVHHSDELLAVMFDKLIIDLESAFGKNELKLAFWVRFQFIVQHESQSVDAYLADLRHSSIDCGFGDQLHNCLKNQFVVSLKA